MFGGEGENRRRFNDLWSLDLKALKWNLLFKGSIDSTLGLCKQGRGSIEDVSWIVIA